MPTFFSKLHSSLSAAFLCLSLPTSALAFQYANTRFSVTKTQSHIRFLRSCLRHHVVPVGFKLKHSPSDKQNHSLLSATTRLLHKSSQKLMSVHLLALQKKLTHIERRRQSLLSSLDKQTDPASRLFIKLTILHFDNLLFEHLNTIKTRKLDSLRSDSKAPTNISQSRQAPPSQTSSAVTQPPSLHSPSASSITSRPRLPLVTDSNAPVSPADYLLSSTVSDLTLLAPTSTITSHPVPVADPIVPDSGSADRLPAASLPIHDNLPHLCPPPTSDHPTSGRNTSHANHLPPHPTPSDTPLTTPQPVPFNTPVDPQQAAKVSPSQPPTHHHPVHCIPADLPLTAAERSVLSRGLKFIPKKPSTSKYDTIRDCQRFFRSLRWMGVLGHPPKRQFYPDDDIFVRLFPTDYRREPPHNKIPALETYVSKSMSEIKHLKFTPSKTSNLTSDELQALESLRKRDDIVIKPADKGGATVVWRRDLYIEEAMRQLHQPKHYQPLDKSPLKADQEKISAAVGELIKSGSLPPTARRLLNHQSKESSFYLLPKIHKDNNPGRPIVSACTSPTVRISEYLDNILQPLMQNLPSFIKDSTHTLNILETLKTDPNFAPTLLFTLDVSSLYTSIPHADGLKALKHFLDRRPDQTPPTTTILRLAELVLTHNAFTFQDTSYAQQSGVAMGTKMGPSYACLFMGYLENQIFQAYNKPTPELYKRYIDDCMGVTSLTRTELQDFIDFVGNFHPAIKFTHEISDRAVTFLDMELVLNQGKITTTVHYKPTDSHSYLDYNSSHNPSTKNSIPFSQFLRLRRLCSEDEDFLNKTEEMKTFFSAKHYPADVVNKALARVRNINRGDTLTTKKDNATEDRPILTLLYHPSTLRVRNILLSNWKILQSDPEAAAIFRLPPLIAYKRDNNLRDLLVRSRLKSQTPRPPPGSTPCGQPKCSTCPFICTATTVCGPNSTMVIHRHFNCQTVNIVYVISCSKCGKLYVGETGRSLATRFKEHLSDIRHNRYKPVAMHFNENNHSVQDVRVKGLWVLMGGSTSDRKDKESHIIEKLGTYTPRGLNLKP